MAPSRSAHSVSRHGMREPRPEGLQGNFLPRHRNNSCSCHLAHACFSWRTRPGIGVKAAIAAREALIPNGISRSVTRARRPGYPASSIFAAKMDSEVKSPTNRRAGGGPYLISVGVT